MSWQQVDPEPVQMFAHCLFYIQPNRSITPARSNSARKMSFEILAAEILDVPAIVAIHQAAFQDGPIVGRLWCDVGPQVRNHDDMRFFEKTIRDRLLTGCHISKLIDRDTG